MRQTSRVIVPDRIYPPPVIMVLLAVIKKLDFGFSEKVRLVLLSFPFLRILGYFFRFRPFGKSLVWLF